MAGTNKQLSASASGLTSALSSSFDVGKATVTGSITANNKLYDGTTAASTSADSAAVPTAAARAGRSPGVPAISDGARRSRTGVGARRS